MIRTTEGGFAIEDLCKHMDEALSPGELQGTILACRFTDGNTTCAQENALLQPGESRTRTFVDSRSKNVTVATD